jgi:hypothetical protein
MAALPGTPAVQAFSAESSDLICGAERLIGETREVLDHSRSVLEQWHKTKANGAATGTGAIRCLPDWQTARHARFGSAAAR